MEIDSPEFKAFIIAVKEYYNKPLERHGDFCHFTKEVNEKIKGSGQISERTVKRLFQSTTQKKFQDTTLDLIAQYMGFEDRYSVINKANKKEVQKYKYYSHSIEVGKLKLHDAMIKILNEAGTPLSPETLAQQINEKALYERNDQQPLKKEQILQRVKVRPYMFSYDEEKDLVILNPSHQKPE